MPILKKGLKEPALRDNISLDKAKQKVLAREKEENTVYERLYNISELFDKKWVDLKIDTSHDSPETLALKVIKAVREL
jgi:cytidylate kinase